MVKQDEAKEVTREFDHNVGATNNNLITLNDIKTEVDILRTDMEMTDITDITAMGMRYRDIDHKIRLLGDLLHYTLEEMNDNLAKTEKIKEYYFDLIVRDNEEAEYK